MNNKRPLRTLNTIEPADIAERERRVLGQPPFMEPLAQSQLSEEDKKIVGTIHRALDMEPTDEVTEYFATMLRHPALLRQQINFSAMLFRGELSPRQRELAILRVAWLNQAPYEWGEHVLLARRIAGMNSAEIDRVTEGASAAGWTEEERAILTAVDEMHTDSMISRKTWALLASHLDEKQLLELPLLVGLYQGTAYLQNSVGFRLAETNEGLAER